MADTDTFNSEGEAPQLFKRFARATKKYDLKSKASIIELSNRISLDFRDNASAEESPSLPTGGWNLEDLYTETLILLNKSFDGNSKQKLESNPVILHLQQAFEFDEDKHKALVGATLKKQEPTCVLNVEVIEAKELNAQDANGLSDPFCTLYLSPKQKHNTSMKPCTLNPSWREYFSLPIANCKKDILTIDVWDYDPDETITNKINSINTVKSTKGFLKFMKEVAGAAASGKPPDELLGRLRIPIQSIPAEGFDKWFHLQNDGANAGQIHIKMIVGAQKDTKTAIQEYRRIKHLLLKHELKRKGESNNIPWDGQFSESSEYILNQLRWQNGLVPHQIDLVTWVVYVRVGKTHRIHSRLFFSLLEEILVYFSNKEVHNKEEISKFWCESERLVEDFLLFLRNIRMRVIDPCASLQASFMLRTLGLFKAHLFITSLMKEDLPGKLTVKYIIERAEHAVTRGAEDLFNWVVKNATESNEGQIDTLISVGKMLLEDLRQSVTYLNKGFKEALGINHFECSYRVYDTKYGELVKHSVAKFCESIRTQTLKREVEQSDDNENSLGANLFVLYLEMKNFANLSLELKSQDDLKIQGQFHTWFSGIVALWLDIACKKAQLMIRKAVELDKLRPNDVSDGSNITSSAVDTLQIFHQIFWKQLAWPEVDGSYGFVVKIIDDLCECVSYYAKHLSRRVQESDKQGEFEVTDELCFVFNNIDHVAAGISTVSEKLDTNKILDDLEEKNGPEKARHCAKNLHVIMANTEGAIRVTYCQILNKLEPILYQLMEKDLEYEGNSQLCSYLDKHLTKLHEKLTEECRVAIFSLIWEITIKVLKSFTDTSINLRRSPTNFQRINNILETVIYFFYPDGYDEADSTSIDSIGHIRDVIELHGASTSELKLRYAHRRLLGQANFDMKQAQNGILTLRAIYSEEDKNLTVEILNCSNLRSCDNNGFSDPYVKLRILPSDLSSIVCLKTRIEKKTLFPLFEEVFSIPLMPEKMTNLGGILHLTVKDYDLLGKNDFIGEAFVLLEPFISSPSSQVLQESRQIKLPLTLPDGDELSILEILEKRTKDPQATSFVRKERRKQATNLPVK